MPRTEEHRIVNTELIKIFSEEFRRKGTVAERREWIKNNRDTICSQCKSKNLRCIPNQEIPCCQACKDAKSNGKCSRNVAEKRSRLMSTLNIDSNLYDALLRSYTKKKSLERLDHDLVDQPPSKNRLVKMADPISRYKSSVSGESKTNAENSNHRQNPPQKYGLKLFILAL
ncbi:hypothetical protein J3R30DRAFT_2171837 [Lentinula aciculospora]|uniref:Uncharacterized protein n=1 Tax=Lentinula aciculospora TaxID=153920 RepID=A0A9W9AGU4_9AGAR|nr:hypothetical protein J3R30DRAFT_2171837 [Lentinula aciculospora]